MVTPPISKLAEVDDLAVIQVRIQGSSEGVKRARFAFLVSTIASLAIFITEWNAYLSWYRHFPLSPAFPANEVTREAYKDVLQQFVESRVIIASLLGIRVGVSDMAVLGSLALLVCSIWLFFSIRRHNHSVGSLLRDTKELAPVVRKLVYYGVSSSLVFTTVTADDAAISSLEAEPSTREAKLSRAVVTFLFYLPATVIALTIAADILSVFVLKAVFSFPHFPLGFRGAGLGRQIQFVAMELAAVAMGVPTFLLCRRIIDFEQSTATVLREYANLLRQVPATPN
jgi:hypothetical protein